MKRLIVVLALTALVLPAVAPAGEEGAVKQTLEEFKAALRADDLDKASTFLSPRFLNALKSGGADSGCDYDFLQVDPVEFVRQELDGTAFEDFQVYAVKASGNKATAELKLAGGKIVKLFLEKDPEKGWQITPAPQNPFQQTQAENQTRIKQLDAKRHAREWREHLADDINADRWDDGWYWSR